MSFGMQAAGRLGNDPEVRATGSGQTLVKFSLAVGGYDRERKEKTTAWVRVVMWGNRGEQIAKLVSKGDSVCFYGTGELKSYENKDGKQVTYLELSASECVLLGGGGEKKEEKTPARGRSRREEDDDVPF
jgi:single-strand DNA-binding protein